MRLVFYINYLNHHQVALTDELYRCLGNTFACICTQPKNLNELKGGKDYSLRSYYINATDSQDMYELALSYAREADVCIFGADSIEFAVERAKNNKSGISFEVGERWFKKGVINIVSPRFIRWLYCYYRYFRHSNFYRLCASAYAAKDVNSVGAYINRCYKWGYFVDMDKKCLDIINEGINNTNSTVRIMWCARFLRLKHPELPIKLAARLMKQGYRFVIDMYGSGEEMEKMKRLVKHLGVDTIVKFHGNISNEGVLHAMCEHDIFLFTSDKNEGWGVVLNEAMSCHCAVVASNVIGSVPYLINEGQNGMIFKSGNLDSLETKVINLIENPDIREMLASNAHWTINNIWSSQVAANNLIILIDAIMSGNNAKLPSYGPCSISDSRY